MRRPRTFLLLPLVLLVAAIAGQEGEDLEPIFDGQTLEGWTIVGKGRFRAEEGEIRCESESKSFLATAREYGDFVLELETMVEPGANSGVQVRSHVNERGALYGYQAEVDTSDRAWSGGLYDEGRRQWLNPVRGDADSEAAFRKATQGAFRNGEWNTYRIECRGDWLRFWVNGVLTTDYRDPLDLTGVIALQHHGEAGKSYRWRNVRLQELGVSRWEPLFDGESLAGWASNGVGTWSVEDGVLVGRSPAAEARHGLLSHEAEYGDFTVRVEFRAVSGNSGLYFRVALDDSAVGCAGFQAEIDPANDVGGLYETAGRGWVVQPPPQLLEKKLRKDDWNDLVVSAHGGRVVVHLNGAKTAELRDDPGRSSGRLALQLHGGQDMEVHLRRIELLRHHPVEKAEENAPVSR